MIDEKDVFIGFFTRRHPVYRFASKISGAVQILFGDVKPQIWSAPAWILQESGYALRGGKELILLREPEVEVFGLQGDLEYITFDPENPAEVFSKLSQMINGLLAKVAGTEVRVIVSERREETQVAIEPALAEPDAKVPRDEAEEPNIIERFLQMRDAAGKRDFDALQGAWKAGTDLIADGKSEKIDQLAWDCLYYENRFEAGAAAGLETLRRLRNENPKRVEPTSAIARCLFDSEEFAESAALYLEAAELEAGPAKAGRLIGAAKAFREAKQYTRGKKAIELALSISTGQLREEAVRLQYQLLKDCGHDYFAFATAEFALHENPELPLRFSLALDYHGKDLNELALYHFKFLYERNKKDSSSLHNLALLYSDCKLPISSVQHYKMAIPMGETLSAANLGFMYLDSGMAEEAKAIIEQAMKVEKHETNVEKCLAKIIQHGEEEKTKEATLLEIASTNRSFFVNMGQALMGAVTCPPKTSPTEM